MLLNINLNVTLTENRFNLYQHQRYNDDKVCHYMTGLSSHFSQQKTIKFKNKLVALHCLKCR